MNGLKTVTDKTLRAWLDSGAVDRSVGDALMFVASTAAARRGKASWILRYRHCGRQREKVLARYPDLSLKDARELARKRPRAAPAGHGRRRAQVRRSACVR